MFLDHASADAEWCSVLGIWAPRDEIEINFHVPQNLPIR